jgi:hypothetical protein
VSGHEKEPGGTVTRAPRLNKKEEIAVILGHEVGSLEEPDADLRDRWPRPRADTGKTGSEKTYRPSPEGLVSGSTGRVSGSSEGLVPPPGPAPAPGASVVAGWVAGWVAGAGGSKKSFGSFWYGVTFHSPKDTRKSSPCTAA